MRRIYNGLHLDRFTYRPPNLNSREILAVGRLVEKKGFDVLVDACGLLRERGIAFHCSIVGEGMMREALQQRIEQLALAKQICLTGPKTDNENIRVINDRDIVKHSGKI